MKPLVLEYLQRTVKFFCKKCPTYVFSTWGAYYQIFSQFLKITFNNVVKKFVKFCRKQLNHPVYMFFNTCCFEVKLLTYVEKSVDYENFTGYPL